MSRAGFVLEEWRRIGTPLSALPSTSSPGEPEWEWGHHSRKCLELALTQKPRALQTRRVYFWRCAKMSSLETAEGRGNQILTLPPCQERTRACLPRLPVLPGVSSGCTVWEMNGTVTPWRVKATFGNQFTWLSEEWLYFFSLWQSFAERSNHLLPQTSPRMLSP